MSSDAYELSGPTTTSEQTENHIRADREPYPSRPRTTSEQTENHIRPLKPGQLDRYGSDQAGCASMAEMVKRNTFLRGMYAS